MALKGSVEKSRDDLVWPAGAVKDSQEQEERFQNTLLEFGIREDELGLPLTEEEARPLDGEGGEGEDDDGDSVEDEDFEQSKVRRRGRRAREGRRRSQGKDEDEDEDDDEL